MYRKTDVTNPCCFDVKNKYKVQRETNYTSKDSTPSRFSTTTKFKDKVLKRLTKWSSVTRYWIVSIAYYSI